MARFDLRLSDLSGSVTWPVRASDEEPGLNGGHGELSITYGEKIKMSLLTPEN